MLRISREHPTLMLKNNIQNAVKDFFQQQGFSYFQYLRCFDNGEISLLTNHTGLFELFPKFSSGPVIFSSFKPEHENCASYWFLWDEELPKVPVAMARHLFNLHHGLTFVKRHKHYYDMIAVALPEEKNNIGSFYLTKMKIIEAFIQDFENQQSDLITHINSQPFFLPPERRDPNYQKMCLRQAKVNETHLTPQEIACLRLLLQGSTYKEIGRTLQLSPRSVETYIARVKQRTGLRTRQDLKQLILLCP